MFFPFILFLSTRKQKQRTMSSDFQTITYEAKDGLCVITLNRPTKKNSFSPEMYVEVSAALSQAAVDDSISVTVCLLFLFLPLQRAMMVDDG